MRNSFAPRLEAHFQHRQNRLRRGEHFQFQDALPVMPAGHGAQRVGARWGAVEWGDQHRDVLVLRCPSGGAERAGEPHGSIAAITGPEAVAPPGHKGLVLAVVEGLEQGEALGGPNEVGVTARMAKKSTKASQSARCGKVRRTRRRARSTASARASPARMDSWKERAKRRAASDATAQRGPTTALAPAWSSGRTQPVSRRVSTSCGGPRSAAARIALQTDQRAAAREVRSSAGGAAEASASPARLRSVGAGDASRSAGLGVSQDVQGEVGRARRRQGLLSEIILDADALVAAQGLPPERQLVRSASVVGQVERAEREVAGQDEATPSDPVSQAKSTTEKVRVAHLRGVGAHLVGTDELPGQQGVGVGNDQPGPRFAACGSADAGQELAQRMADGQEAAEQTALRRRAGRPGRPAGRRRPRRRLSRPPPGAGQRPRRRRAAAADPGACRSTPRAAQETNRPTC